MYKLIHSITSDTYYMQYMTKRTKRTAMTNMLPIVFVIGASLVMASGMATPALALKVAKDPDEASVSLQDFDIKSFGMAGKDTPYIQVYGHAGRTLATGEDQIYAYVVYTDDGIWAVNNHGFSHGDPEGDVGHIWHSERVIFDDPNNPKCLVGADNQSENRMDGTRVFITNSGAKQVFKAQTVELVHVMDDPDETECPGSIARLVQVFDTAQ